MKLGEILVRDGRITEAQLATALSYQAREGGRLGTILVEHGLVDIDAITVYLGLELGIPIATGAMFERAKRSAVRLLAPAQAFKHRCVPLVIQDRQLIAAISDPHDFATLETLTSIIGYRVLPRVAPEIRIYYYIERYYGVARPARFLTFGDSPRGKDSSLIAGLPAPPLPGLPPAPTSPIAAPAPAPAPGPRLRSMKLATLKMFDDSEALELEAEDLLDTLDADDTAPAEAAPNATPLQPSAPTTTHPPSIPPPAPPPMSEELALRELGGAADRNRIVEVLLGFAAKLFDAAVVFTVRDHLAFGWRAIGELPGHANVEHILIPLEATSVVQAAIAAEDNVFHGPLTPSTVNSYFYKVLGCAEPALVTAGAITIGRRVVNVLYGHATPLTPVQLQAMQQVCKSAAEAYARLIAVSKKKK